jgi:hypothetical protein
MSAPALGKIVYSICYENNIWGWILTYFMIEPNTLFVGSMLMTSIYGSDLAFFIVGFGPTIAWLYAIIYNRSAKIPRPPLIRDCGEESFAYPEPDMTSNASTCFIIMGISITRQSRIPISAFFTMGVFLILNSFAYWFNGYLNAAHLIGTLSFAYALSLPMVYIHTKIITPFEAEVPKSRVLRFLGFNNLLDRYQNTNHKLI